MHSRNFSREIPFSQLSRPLSEAEVTGAIARDVLGLLPARRLQPSMTTVVQRDPRHVAYVHPPLRREAPKPSERRAAPRHPDSHR